jgi:hypothetical protein
MISAKTACWDIKENSQIFNEDFYLPLYFPLCMADMVYPGISNIPKEM